MKGFLAAALLLLGSAVVADDAVILFPAPDSPARLGLEITTDGKPPETAWVAFLDRLFDYLDTDADEVLTRHEAQRVFALPTGDGREARMDFASVDRDRDGKGSRAEFREFYRRVGFSPVVVVVRAGPPDRLRLGDAVFRHLDRDGDGLLTATELGRIPDLLRRLDEDEDEVLIASELLATTSQGSIPAAGLSVPSRGDTRPGPRLTLRVALGGVTSLVGSAAGFRLSSDGSRLTVPGGVCVVRVAGQAAIDGFHAARKFYAAQFQAVAGDNPSGKAVLADDPATQVLAGLFDPADRNGDGRLTRTELAAFLDLIEAGVGCRVVVTVTDHGRNLFDRIDRDGDGRLDLAELTDAGRQIPGELAAAMSLPRNGIPGSYTIAIGPGTPGDSFGPVPFGAVARPGTSARPAVRGPRWFLALDRNGDGFVSAAEFPGPPELFSKLDRDHDGRIGPAEAEAAGR